MHTNMANHSGGDSLTELHETLHVCIIKFIMLEQDLHKMYLLFYVFYVDLVQKQDLNPA